MKKITVTLACLLALGTASIAFANEGFGPGKHFAKIDANADGKVTKAEHAKAADARFTLMDANKDGVLTMDEMKHGRGMRGGHGHGPGASCDHEQGHEHGNKPKAAPSQGAAGSAGH